MQLDLTEKELIFVIKAVEDLERNYSIPGCQSLSAKLLRISGFGIPRPEDFKSRLDYGRACYKAGVIPEPRAVFKRK
jgi:hypothetical protein